MKSQSESISVIKKRIYSIQNDRTISSQAKSVMISGCNKMLDFISNNNYSTEELCNFAKQVVNSIWKSNILVKNKILKVKTITGLYNKIVY